MLSPALYPFTQVALFSYFPKVLHSSSPCSTEIKNCNSVWYSSQECLYFSSTRNLSRSSNHWPFLRLCTQVVSSAFTLLRKTSQKGLPFVSTWVHFCELNVCVSGNQNTEVRWTVSLSGHSPYTTHCSLQMAPTAQRETVPPEVCQAVILLSLGMCAEEEIQRRSR